MITETGERPHPDRDQRPDPCGEQPGEQEQRQFLAVEPERFKQDHGGDDRGPEDHRHRCEAPRPGNHSLRLVRGVTLDRSDCDQPQASTDRDQWRLPVRSRAPGRSTQTPRA